MANWLEEIVAELYRLKGYIVVQNEDLLLPRGSRKVGAHSDIDVWARSESEVLIIECKTYWGDYRKEEEPERFRRLREHYNLAEQTLRERYSWLSNLPFKKVYVTGGQPKNPRGGPWSRLEAFCNEEGIELKTDVEVVKEFLSLLKEKYPSSKPLVGRELHILTRYTLFLLRAGLVRGEL